jgi:hypothetical protein
MSNRVSSVTTFSSNSWAQDVPAASRTLVCSALVMRSSQIVLTSPERADSPEAVDHRGDLLLLAVEVVCRLLAAAAGRERQHEDPRDSGRGDPSPSLDHPSILPPAPGPKRGAFTA